MNDAVVYAASVAPLENTVLFERAYNSISAERRRKTDSYRFLSDKKLSVGAGLLLGYALDVCGYKSGENEIVLGVNGKPYLRNRDLFFNISHSGEYVICALSGYENGCDIEKIKTSDIRISKRFFTPEEYARINSLPEQTERDDLFFRYWTLKESFMKATGRGMSLPLNSFEIVISGDIKVIQSVDDRNYTFTEFDCINGYKCALCVAGNCENVCFNRVDFNTFV